MPPVNHLHAVAAGIGAAVGAGVMWCAQRQQPGSAPPSPPPVTVLHTDRFLGKVCVITGAASGLGRATAEQVAREGGCVLLTDVNAEALKSIAASLPADRVATAVADVSDRDAAERVVAEAEHRWGHVDLLVNSAGITARNVRAEADFEERWDQVMKVNVKGTLLMSHAAVDAFRRRPDGAAGSAIVNLGSINSYVTYPPHLNLSDGFNPYPHSKGAILQISRDQGVQLASDGIRVNAVCPGFIKTALTAGLQANPALNACLSQRHAMGRLGDATEVASLICFLLSDEASFITAQGYLVDGGYTAN